MSVNESTESALVIARLAQQGYVSLNGFAKIAGVSYPTALKMRDRGDVRVVKVGGVYRIYAEEVRRFLKEGNYQVSTETATELGLMEES